MRPCPAISWDHPRSRGVYAGLRHRLDAGHGSSPLARGLRRPRRAPTRSRRIIPARAGFTYAPAATGPGRTDHPRSRGVYGGPITARSEACGSSPLARGLLRRLVPGGRRQRIIPARAGFTSGGRAGPSKHRDHPRSRGVYTRSARRRPGVPRIIPARAGFTRRFTHRTPARADHPRSRGVYAGEGEELVRLTGSSPLARGLPGRVGASKGYPGIIPARAGFTVFRRRGC